MQMYGNVPDVVNVTLPDSPVLNVLVCQLLSTATALCGAWSLLVQVTVSPTLMVTVWGENAIPSMFTCTVAPPPAAPPPVVGVPPGAAVVVVLPLLHPTRTTAMAMRAAPIPRKIVRRRRERFSEFK